MEQIIFHIDVNSAFLSWTATDMLANGSEIDIRNIPSIIGGDIEKRHGIVLAKSIPAKAYHITTGEPVVNAKRKCPNLTIYPPDFSIYQRMSHALMDYLRSLTPDIEQVSIDECYLYFTPIAARYASPTEAATLIKDTIKKQFGFTVNVGISDRKILAKMASDFKKPDLVHTLFHTEIKEKMWPLPVSELFMCGKSSVETLHRLGILTIGDLAKADPVILTAHLKSHGQTLWNFANGIDGSTVNPTPSEAKGVGNSHTLEKDATTKEEVYPILLSLSDSVAARLRAAGKYASMVSTEIRYSSFKNVSHQCSLPYATNSSDEIYKTARSLFDEIWDGAPIRLLGVRTSKLTGEVEPRQIDLFDYMDTIKQPSLSHKRQELDKALDTIRSKYGSGAVTRGSLFQRTDLPKPKKDK